jgi:hypothetical protein
MGWLKWSLGVAVVVGTIAVIFSSVTGDYDVGSTIVGLALVYSGIVLAACLIALVFHEVPRRWRPLVLAGTVLPLIAAAAAVGLPESAIHFSDHEEWAYRAGREISVGALWVGAAIAAAVAWRHSYKPLAIVGVAALAFGLAAVARDLFARDQQPSWCYADKVEAGPDGSVATAGEYDDCTVLLPARDPV